jgi:uncharacterized protein
VSLYDDLPAGAAGEKQEPVVVPYTELSAAALEGVIKAFVLREGTDYGEREFTLEQKVAHVRVQLERGDAQIYFDPGSNSVDILKAPQRVR